MFCLADVHALDLPNESIDVVLASGVLHHLDLKQVCNEIIRVLRPEGILVAREPLGINPIFNWYRNRTPEARTHDEKPLKQQDLELLNNMFFLKTTKYLGFISLFSAFYKNRKLRSFLLWFDMIISKTFFKKYFWYVWGIWEKKGNII